MADGWIIVERWDEFQHYRDRDPIWLKVYTRLLSDEAYLALTFHQRGVLQGIWLEYARANRQLSDRTVALTRRLGQRVSTRDLEALNHAGFITISASKPLAPCYHDASPETEKRREEQQHNKNRHEDADPPTAINGKNADVADPELLNTLLELGWQQKQINAAAHNPQLAAAWANAATTPGITNPGGYAWNGFTAGGTPPPPRTKHPDELTYEEKNPEPCPLCKLRFPNPDLVIDHLHTHRIQPDQAHTVYDKAPKPVPAGDPWNDVT